MCVSMCAHVSSAREKCVLLSCVCMACMCVCVCVCMAGMHVCVYLLSPLDVKTSLALGLVALALQIGNYKNKREYSVRTQSPNLLTFIGD